MTEQAAKPSKKTLQVPKGGHKTFNFELTPNTKNSCDSPWELVYVDEKGEKTEVSELKISFSDKSSPAEKAVEYGLILVSMSAQAEGWSFVPSVIVYKDDVAVTNKITTELAYKVTSEATDSDLKIRYGFLAILDGTPYTEPDPIIIVGRP